MLIARSNYHDRIQNRVCCITVYIITFTVTVNSATVTVTYIILSTDYNTTQDYVRVNNYYNLLAILF